MTTLTMKMIRLQWTECRRIGEGWSSKSTWRGINNLLIIYQPVLRIDCARDLQTALAIVVTFLTSNWMSSWLVYCVTCRRSCHPSLGLSWHCPWVSMFHVFLTWIVLNWTHHLSLTITAGTHGIWLLGWVCALQMMESKQAEISSS